MTNNDYKIVVAFLPATKWWKRSRWLMIEEYTSSNGAVTVPAGFITDGATVPWLLQWLFPVTGEYFSAAIVHDYILDTTDDWRYANQQFNIELTLLPVKSWRRKLLSSGVCFWWILRRSAKRD